MVKKVFLIILLLFILFGNHVHAPSKYFSEQLVGTILQPSYDTNIAFAAEPGQNLSKTSTTVESFSWSSYIVPGTAGIVLVIVIGGYWLVFRKRQTQKEA